ncbi:MAG: DUF2173 family protein [Pseudomonadota bacterium]
MNLIAKLMDMPGVIAAGSYTFKGEEYKYQGPLSEKEAHKLAALCYANMRTVRMQGDMLQMVTTICKPGVTDCGMAGAKGWVVHGQQRSVCVVYDTFCVLSNTSGSLDDVLHLMLESQPDWQGVLI